MVSTHWLFGRWVRRAANKLLQRGHDVGKMLHPRVTKHTMLELETHMEPYFVKAVQGLPKSQRLPGSYLKSNGLQEQQRFGEDSWFISSTNRADVLGVADGVGAWKALGVDPGVFAKQLMYWCANFAEQPQFDGSNVRELLSKSYEELCVQAQPVVGSSTACLVALNRRDCMLHTANLGDSGYLVLRGGKVLQRSVEQQHAFNTPYQLTVPPEDQTTTMLCDRPELADCKQLPLQLGDVVLLATDGLFDNVPESMLIRMLSQFQGETQHQRIQQGANALVAMARDLSLSAYFPSPFAVKAKASKQPYPGGGKPDDITVILASVAERKYWHEVEETDATYT